MTVQGHRAERVAEEIRNEVSLMLAGELKDPRIAGDVTITEVRIGAGMRTVRIFVRVDGSEEERKKTIKGLEAARGFARHELVERLHMRRAPEIIFALDQTEEIEKRINELLHKPSSPEKP